LWALLQDVPLGVIGFGARAGTFLGIGLIMGLQSQRRLRLQDDREWLIGELRETASSDQLTGVPIAGLGTIGSRTNLPVLLDRGSR